MQGTPSWALLDKEGGVIEQWFGHCTEEHARQLIRRALQE